MNVLKRLQQIHDEYLAHMLLSGILAKVNEPNDYILISHKHKFIP